MRTVPLITPTLAAILLSLTSLSCVPDPATQFAPLLDRYVAYWNTGMFEGIEDVLHSDFELRMTPRFEPEQGIEAFQNSVTLWRRAYPDFHIVIDEVFYSQHAAAARWTITATNSGDGWHPATGKAISVPGMSIVHFADGKIKDEWIASNNEFWLQQLGFTMQSPFEK